MNKYRVLKPYPKQITNSGRLLTLTKGRIVYLKSEPQVKRLVAMGFIKPVVGFPAKPKKKSKPAPKKEVKMEEPKKEVESKAEEFSEESKEEVRQNNSRRKRRSKSEYLNKKK
jgi:hypothetical protein